MGFFDDDPFEDIMKEFFGGTTASGNTRKISDNSEMISGEDEERNIDFIETPNQFFVVFELPGYDKEDVKLEIKNNKIIVNARKKPTERVQDYLSEKLSSGVRIMKQMPGFIKIKKYDFSFSNGILEVKFKK